jgi:hypothetical protein
MGYTFGRPQPTRPQTIVGEIPRDKIVVPLIGRIKVVARVPDSVAREGGDLAPDFEQPLREAIANALLGLESGGFAVVSVAVEQFEGADG